MFKVGDTVRCTDDTGAHVLNHAGGSDLYVGQCYVVAGVFETDENIMVEGNPFRWHIGRFELVESKEEVAQIEESLLCIIYAGNVVHFDPSIPHSREFADAMLDVVYNFNKGNK